MKAILINKKTHEIVYLYDTLEKKPTFRKKEYQEYMEKVGLTVQSTSKDQGCKSSLRIKLDDPHFHQNFFENLPGEFSGYQWKLLDKLGNWKM